MLNMKRKTVDFDFDAELNADLLWSKPKANECDTYLTYFCLIDVS